MTTRIQSPTLAPVPTTPTIDATTASAASRTGRASMEVTAPLPVDQVKLSDQSTFLAQASERPSTLATLDQARVDAVRNSLKAGTYRIDPHEIAARLVRLERELHG